MPIQDLTLPTTNSDPKTIGDIYIQEYDRVVTNLAGIMVMQCNLYQQKVPDRVTPTQKPQALLRDIIEKLKEVL